MTESRSAGVTLETMEGDRVTLSFSSRTEAAYQVYNARGGLDGAPAARLETFTFSSGSEMTIAIEGEISDAEKADIEMVMSVVEEMAKEFFEGDVDEALAELLKMGEARTIAGLQVSLESSSTVTIGSQGGAPEGGPADATAAALPAAPAAQAAAGAQPQAAAPVVTGPAPSAATQTPPADASPIAADAAAAPAGQPGRITVDTTNGLVGSMASTVAESGINLSRTEKHMLRLLDRLFDKFAEDFGFGEDKHKVAELVKSEFAGELNEMASGEEAHEADGHGGGHGHGAEKAERGHKERREHDNGRGHKHGHEHKHRH